MSELLPKIKGKSFCFGKNLFSDRSSCQRTCADYESCLALTATEFNSCVEEEYRVELEFVPDEYIPEEEKEQDLLDEAERNLRDAIKRGIGDVSRPRGTEKWLKMTLERILKEGVHHKSIETEEQLDQLVREKSKFVYYETEAVPQELDFYRIRSEVGTHRMQIALNLINHLNEVIRLLVGHTLIVYYDEVSKELFLAPIPKKIVVIKDEVESIIKQYEEKK